MSVRAKKLLWFVLLGMIVVLVPGHAAGQQGGNMPRYNLIDLGTFGGPNSFIDCCGVQPVLNNQGTMVGGAETSLINPNFNASPQESFLCGSPDPLINPAFKWEKGVLTNLKALPGGFNSFAAFVSATGLIVGSSETGQADPLLGGPQCHPAIWTSGRIIDLGTLGGYQGVALESNGRDQVVGVVTNSVPDALPGLIGNTVPTGFQPGTQQRAFLWDGGIMVDLNTLGGPDAAAAFINDRGQIAGVSYTNSIINGSTGIPTQHPFLWQQGRMVDLMASAGGTFGFVAGLNNQGQVAGQMSLPGDAQFHPFLWSAGTLTDLRTLGGDNGEAYAINDAGEVVGRADLPGSAAHHAFLWKNGVMSDLGTLNGETCSTAYSINSSEQVVGDTGICGVGGGPPFLSEHGAPMVDLTTLVIAGSNLTIVDASYINDPGEIACQAFDPDGNLHACLLVPATPAEIAAAAQTATPKPPSLGNRAVPIPRKTTSGTNRLPAFWIRDHDPRRRLP